MPKPGSDPSYVPSSSPRHAHAAAPSACSRPEIIARAREGCKSASRYLCVSWDATPSIEQAEAIDEAAVLVADEDVVVRIHRDAEREDLVRERQKDALRADARDPVTAHGGDDPVRVDTADPAVAGVADVDVPARRVDRNTDRAREER